MPDLNRVDLRQMGVAVVLAVALFATSCGGGARPTITDERLDTTSIGTDQAVEVPQSDQVDDVPQAAQADTPAPAPDGAPANEALPPAISLPAGVVEDFTLEIVETYPHDPAAFTQGLELVDGVLIESTGGTGVSDLRRVNLDTGEVLQLAATPDDLFAEGVTLVGDQLVQLTWKSFTAFYWDATTFELNQRASYSGEGWGLCYDGARLIMSNGSANLIFRDPETFLETGRTAVTLNGDEVTRLNELECVNGMVWANIWDTDFIVRIDPATGAVNGLVDASQLNEPAAPNSDVLNGIAWDATTETFLLTGKFWPTMYRVRLVPASES